MLKPDGTVWAFGHNGYGQLGEGTTTQRSTPVEVSGLTDIVAVAAGANHSMAITSTGDLYLWGYNGYGQLGDATTTNRNAPIQSTLTNVVAIAAGQNHSLALRSNGDVYALGALFDFIEVFYNQQRRHSTLGQISPAEDERRMVSQVAQRNRPRDRINSTHDDDRAGAAFHDSRARL